MVLIEYHNQVIEDHRSPMLITEHASMLGNEPQGLSEPDLSEGGFEMLRAAVNTVSDHQCRSLQSLKERLAITWPGRGADIDAAIAFWAASVRHQHPGGVPPPLNRNTQ